MNLAVVIIKMITVSPNLSKTLSLTLEIIDALDNRDFELATQIDQKRQLYCKKDVEFDEYDWLKYNLIKRIQESIIDEIMNVKKNISAQENKIYRNAQVISKGYLN